MRPKTTRQGAKERFDWSCFKGKFKETNEETPQQHPRRRAWERYFSSSPKHAEKGGRVSTLMVGSTIGRRRMEHGSKKTKAELLGRFFAEKMAEEEGGVALTLKEAKSRTIGKFA